MIPLPGIEGYTLAQSLADDLAEEVPETYIRRIYKWELLPAERQMIQMPKGATVLKVGRQGPLAFLWAEVDPEAPTETRIFRNLTTGERYNSERLFYHGHVQLGGEVKPNGVVEGWYELFCFEVETALPQLRPDPLDPDPRYREDRVQLQQEQRDETE